MGEYEELIREKIKEKFGSVPKMAEATGLAATTIYHALDRGMDNTRTETSDRIALAVFGTEKPSVRYSAISLAENEPISEAEQELLDLFRSMDPYGQEQLLVFARGCAASYPKNQAHPMGA